MQTKPVSLSDPIAQFEVENAQQIAGYPGNREWQDASRNWMRLAFEQRYMYHFAWMGRPIIQTPVDMVAFQEIVWKVKPDLIIETGIAHGGSLILSASLLSMLDICDALERDVSFNPRESKRKVLGIDIDIRAHNKAAIEAHPMAHMIQMIQGSSIDAATIAQVKNFAKPYQTVLVCLDSNHTHSHVLAELEAYAPLATVGSYCLVFDTIVEDMPELTFPDRPWKPGDNPKTAVWEYLRSVGKGKFEIDRAMMDKLMITVAPDGFLKRVG